ncbi:MAG: hypothetical protein QOG40_1841 [Solirubrobacteraceae bacterium]|nr:hypothetical protein [Solirubrobacteraceae bacterium]
MSQENVELVRRALRAGRSEFAELLDPAIRLDLSERVFNPFATTTTASARCEMRDEQGEAMPAAAHTAPADALETVGLAG